MAYRRARSGTKRCTSAIERGVVFVVSIEEQIIPRQLERWPVRLLLPRDGAESNYKMTWLSLFGLLRPALPSHDTLITHGLYLWMRAAWELSVLVGFSPCCSFAAHSPMSYLSSMQCCPSTPSYRLPQDSDRSITLLGTATDCTIITTSFLHYSQEQARSRGS